MEKSKRKNWQLILKITPLFITLSVIIVSVVMFRKWTFDDIVSFTPKNFFLSLLAFMGLYALKSLSVVIPLTIFFVAAGIIYNLPAAITVSVIGLCVSFTLPYLIGKFSGSGLIDALRKKYPKINKLKVISDNNNFFASYVTRAVVFVPGDVVSIILGAAKIRFVPYLFGSIMGVLPEMIFQVMIGHYIGEEVCAKMIISLVVMILLSFVISYLINQKQKSKNIE